jgi:prevent-host-death family protein
MERSMSTVVNVHEAKTHLSRILEDVAAGAEVVIAKAGKPVARLVPIESTPKPKQLGLLRGRIKVPADFNAPLPADVLADFESR